MSYNRFELIIDAKLKTCFQTTVKIQNRFHNSTNANIFERQEKQNKSRTDAQKN
jgi:hypothetical protein